VRECVCVWCMARTNSYVCWSILDGFRLISVVLTASFNCEIGWLALPSCLTFSYTALEQHTTLLCPSLLHSNSPTLPSIDPSHASLSILLQFIRTQVTLSYPILSSTLFTHTHKRTHTLPPTPSQTPTHTHTPHTHTHTHTHTTPRTHTHTPRTHTHTHTLFFTERRARLSLTTVSKHLSWVSP
jgi:hypothetical protein